MKARTRNLLIGGSVVALMGGALVANALWNAQTDAPVPDFSIGSVRFSAEESLDADSRTFSDGGAPVSVTLPGSKIIEVLDQTSIDAEPVIWRFTAKGTALGIAGLNYSVATTEQRTDDDAHDLTSGVAKPGSVLERTTMKVYPAAAGGDCSAVPETPELAEGETPKNVYLYDTVDVELQAPGAALTGAESEQEWCVALDWNDVADGTYVNDVQVTGLAEDGSFNGATDRWHAAVGYPPALELLGVYHNRALAEATAEDTTKARATADWSADVYPDPSGEPDVVIELDPIVTNLNPDVDPRD
ncbi:hypothetical protein [Leucobacter luti]|uniref:Ribosomally synthesized peptide with SipW-like signal peptide n=1 Tax=Leucobacter luti TaxID=340320 RepID=A0A4Q7TZT6_9MICO|nr:hypothetical protein [Leucobacter luti]MBL3699143.1 hypothetical protein [Leucobacter luti]RZT66644.1 hypothetical protein EV139_0765 [Leucobacter luti]